jgi:hypothetical protein
MPVLSFRQRLRKLKAVSTRELVVRARYEAALRLERRRWRAGTLAPPDRLSNALRRDLSGPDWRTRLLEARSRQRGAWLPGTRDLSTTVSVLRARYRAECDATADEAARVRAHEFSFFGDTFRYGRDIDWMADPVTGAQWPPAFHADVPVHGGNVGYGDVKHVWELSRQQYLVDLAKAHVLTGDQVNLAELEQLVRSWIAGNPYATGVNWSCALEPAFRAWSWLWSYYLTADALAPEFHLEWLEGFYDHARFLARHLELYSSPYNHLIGEASALFVLGLSFPEFAEASAWRRTGAQLLEERLGEQFYADGGSVEQSTFYHHATTGFYMLAAIAGRSMGHDLSPRIWSALERAVEFSLWLSQPDGRTPEIGGADDGKPIRLEQLPLWDFRPYQAIGAVMFQRADFRAVAGRFHEDALWLLGTEGLTAFERLPATAPSALAVLLPKSGYFVGRTGWHAGADYLSFDCGEQAAGMRTDDVPNSMHGHADALSITAFLSGRRVLVDAGLFAYNAGGAWEAHFRETAAHNTARVDGRDQARHIGKMAWSNSYRTDVAAHHIGHDQCWIVASHDGYARGPHGVTHRRAAWLRAGGYFIVLDEFDGAGAHELEVNFQFAPGTLALANGRARFDDAAELAWVGSTEWTAEVRCGGESPADGWICSSLGVRTAAPRLSLRAHMTDAPVALLTIAAAAGAHDRLATLHTAVAPPVLAVRTAAGVEVVSSGRLHDVFATDALLAVQRVAPGSGVMVDTMLGTRFAAEEGALRRLLTEAGIDV